mmetsp:Transcript_19660/g.41006  ORF Transcript_19660/g.41006 Transcript_19660/m.41006 type:complete len:310 (-) Transcript_19660:117-1046(-)
MNAMKASTYRHIGNIAHAAVLGSIGIYGYSILQLLDEFRPNDNHHVNTNNHLFQVDPHWLENGFCMPHAEIPNFTTHERCGYFMILASLLGFLLLSSLPDTHDFMSNARERTQWALFGAIGHACGHIILAVTKRHGLLPSGDVSAVDEFLAEHRNWVTFAKHLPGYFLFWIPLIKTYMTNVSRANVMGFAFLVMVGAMQFPLKFGFSYTLIVLFAGQALDQLLFLRKEKKENLEFMVWPLVTLLPNFFISVMESMWCGASGRREDPFWLGDLFERHGHLVFDGYMAISYTIYYLICWFGNNVSVKMKTV